MNRSRNIKLVIAFDGTGYAGWQRQKKDRTIQGVLEEAVAIMTSAELVVNGAGRTDAGVHALGMTANFYTDSQIPCAGFVKGLNSILPDDIRVLKADEAPEEFHARRSARAKTYIYNISTGQIEMPTERLYATHVPWQLDLTKMRRAAGLLVGTHDFASFEATGSRDRTRKEGRGAVREIFTAEFSETGPDRLRFTITGDGFLRHMVRNIIGTLIEVGQLKRSVNDFATILAAKDRTIAGPTAPACGLFLKEVLY